MMSIAASRASRGQTDKHTSRQVRRRFGFCAWYRISKQPGDPIIPIEGSPTRPGLPVRLASPWCPWDGWQLLLLALSINRKATKPVWSFVDAALALRSRFGNISVHTWRDLSRVHQKSHVSRLESQRISLSFDPAPSSSRTLFHYSIYGKLTCQSGIGILMATDNGQKGVVCRGSVSSCP